MAYANSDLGFVVTKPSNFYARLNTYTQDYMFGPPLPPVVPSMQYITLPQEHVNYGYEALTHDSNGDRYYNVTSGYGNRCTTFNTAKCPTNQIISAAGAPGPAPAPSPAIREGYCHPTPVKSTPKTLQKQIVELDLVVYVDNKNCGHCRNMKKMMENEDLLELVELKDINNKENRKELLKMGGQGVPFVLSKKLGTNVTGAPPNMVALVAMLHEQKPSVSRSIASQLKDLNLVVYVSDMCSYCKMYKQFIKDNGLRPYFRIVNVSNKDETENDSFLKTNNLVGYPTTYSCKYKTSFPGVPKDVEQIIALLTKQN